MELHWIRFDIITLEHQISYAFFLAVFAKTVNKTKIAVYAIASCNLEINKMHLKSVTQTAI